MAISSKKSGRGGTRVSTGGSHYSGKVADSPVKWPVQGQASIGRYNRATKVPIVKTAVVGHGA